MEPTAETCLTEPEGPFEVSITTEESQPRVEGAGTWSAMGTVRRDSRASVSGSSEA